MKCALTGGLAAVLVLIAAAVIMPQYSDYRAAAETAHWLSQLSDVQRSIESNILRNRSLDGSGDGVKPPGFSAPAPDYVHVTRDGSIFVKGGREGQLVVLVPRLDGPDLSWHCIGGPTKATYACRSEP